MTLAGVLFDPMSAERTSEGLSGDDDGALAEVVRVRGAELIAALDQRLPGAAEHAEAAGAYAFAAAARLELDRGTAELCRETAKLHDVGKAQLPGAIVTRPAAELGPGEREQLESHVEAGSRLAFGAGVPDQICGWIVQTRERFDGQGPERLRGDQIPLASRISRAACELDSAIAAAEGDAAARLADARSSLASQSGRELDPAVVAALDGALVRAVR